MMAVDEAGQILSISTTAEKLFGYASEEITGRDIRRLLPDYARSAATTAGDVRSANTPQTRVITGLDRQGNEMPMELAVGEAILGEKRIAIAFVRDLREQIANQVRLSELRDQLLHASRVSAMGEMGAGLAHELNQPLTATANLLGAATLRLKMGASSEQVRELVELANLEVLRAGEIIRRMRAFVARGERTLRVISLDGLITDALQLARSCTPRANVHINYQSTMPTPAILADHIQMQQVLLNIIRNALTTFVSHGTENPEIVIRTDEHGDDEILVRVLDNGPGFAPSILAHPFEAFVSTRSNGLGLGLSICRRIIEGHGGVLTLANRPEGGAVVEFTLPAYHDMSPMATE